MVTKQNIHKLYLLASALIVLHGTILIMSRGGAFNVGAFRTYTTLSNYLVVIGFLLMLVLYNNKGKFRSYLSVCVIVSITVTGLVYNFVLVPFAGMDMFFSYYSNFVTHFLSTILVLFNYFFFEKKGTFTFRHILVGIVFAFVYWVVFVSIGGIINYYPYFFMNPAKIGWFMTFVWFGIILAVIAVLGLLLVLFDKSRGKKINIK
jgi:hypothetical protein